MINVVVERNWIVMYWFTDQDFCIMKLLVMGIVLTRIHNVMSSFK